MHAEAERQQRDIVVYLLPGLTVAQRKAALRRLRQAGSRGYGPRLPLTQLATALAVDRMRSGVGNTAAAVRHHPVGMLLPTVLAGALLAVFVSASVSVRMTGAPVPGRPGIDSWSAPAGTPGRAGTRTGTPLDSLSSETSVDIPSVGPSAARPPVGHGGQAGNDVAPPQGMSSGQGTLTGRSGPPVQIAGAGQEPRSRPGTRAGQDPRARYGMPPGRGTGAGQGAPGKSGEAYKSGPPSGSGQPPWDTPPPQPRTAPQGSGYQRTAPQPTAPQYTAPQHPAPQNSGSQQGGSWN
jgi:hypothetical protein